MMIYYVTGDNQILIHYPRFDTGWISMVVLHLALIHQDHDLIKDTYIICGDSGYQQFSVIIFST